MQILSTTFNKNMDSCTGFPFLKVKKQVLLFTFDPKWITM